VRKYKLSGAECFGIAELEQRSADRRRREKSEVMMRMVRECACVPPLPIGVDLEPRAASDAVRVGDDESRPAPDDTSSASAVATSNFDDRLP